MKEVLEEFSILLRERLSKMYTTEDSVRFTFFAALLKRTNIAPHEIILEYPHPKIPGAEVDTYIPSPFEKKDWFLNLNTTEKFLVVETLQDLKKLVSCSTTFIDSLNFMLIQILLFGLYILQTVKW